MGRNETLNCTELPCADVRRESCLIPDFDLRPEGVSLVMISEAAPGNPADFYYAGGNSLFEQTTLLAFQDAGAPVGSFQDILNRGVYLTTAVKCGKTGYGIAKDTIRNCSFLLEKELALFPNVKAYLLMGDAAIQAFNWVARRAGADRVIPAGSTYKLREQAYYYQGKRVFPSYLQAGPSFFIEKSKRKMIAEDIAQALQLVDR